MAISFPVPLLPDDLHRHPLGPPTIELAVGDRPVGEVMVALTDRRDDPPSTGGS
jgi:hypothetical protein